MPAITTNGLTKEFGDVTAVDDASLTVEEGEIFGFLGPNGAGKSTVINVLLGFVTPTSGTATVLGRDVEDGGARLRESVGVLPEGTSLYERLTGREHLESVARLKGVDVDPDAVLDRVGLSREAGDRKAGGYSKGMAQRLALGMALVGDPDLLILDEPSSGLDPTGMGDVRDVVRAFADDGGTVFFSSHIMGEVEAVCDRVGIMNEGRLVAVDSVDGLRDELGTGSVLGFEVDRIPDTDGIAVLDAVRAVETDGSRIEVACTDDAAKIDVIRQVDRAATIRDVTVEESSLADLFDAYTGEQPDGRDGDRGEPEVRAA